MKRNGLRWYQLVHRLLYRLDLVFWQRSAPPADFVARVEGPSALQPGHALELGCDTGTDTIYLVIWPATAGMSLRWTSFPGRWPPRAAGHRPRASRRTSSKLT
jgi:hypothetical protein